MTAPVPDQVVLRVRSDPKVLPLVRATVAEAATLAGLGGEERDTLLLAVTEAFSNVVRHAYRERHDQPVELFLTPTAGCLKLEIVDYARFVDPARIASRPLDEIRPGGLGVHLIRSTMDQVEYNQNPHGGTTLTLVKRAAGST